MYSSMLMWKVRVSIPHHGHRSKRLKEGCMSAFEWYDSVSLELLHSVHFHFEIITWRWFPAAWFEPFKMFRLWSHVGLNRDWAHFTGLLFPSLSLLAELHKDKALIWKSIPHTRLSQQHTGFHYLEQVASARRSATLRIKVGGFWGPQASPCLLPESQSVSVSLLLRRLSDHATSLSPPCLTPFPLISYV